MRKLKTREYAKVYVSDSDENGKLLQPSKYVLNYAGKDGFSHTALDDSGRAQRYDFDWLDPGLSYTGHHLFIQIARASFSPFITAGLLTFILGVILDQVISRLPRKPKPAADK